MGDRLIDDPTDFSKPPAPAMMDAIRSRLFPDKRSETTKPFTIKFKRSKYTEDKEADELNTSIVKYHVDNFVERNQDLYFVKIVAGALKKKFTDLIVIESKTSEEDDRSNYDLDIVYRKQDDLQSAWAQTMEQMKLMLGERRCDRLYSSSDSFYLRVILKHESLMVAMAIYVAFLMTGTSKWLVMKYNTEKELINQNETKKKLYLDLMRELHRVTGHVRNDLVKKWFPGYNFYFC